MKRKFSKTFVVTKAAIDDLNHVNNVVYLQWCMDIAEQHWEERAVQSVKDEYVWVALNHYISYKAASFEGDELVIETWIVSLEGVKSERKYKIYRPKDNKTIVEAKTEWCLLKSETKRPSRVPKEIQDMF
ncbi:acyl-CoA thioesterase [Croceibacter atlanticus]|uniref:Acyl-ACP thioesterase N-terminal hotdog domain-containing protein n=1 Tax=Croceibacter atlanticus (strain ATCC BAA-628 / JCM 21780 / CIP 108009 / IAM 15332 / KCTC 12090 / HTCC2559) TaxID=216432 RepID=A3U6H2_CROAH|nr:acyl-CoA thioesterase [Croceibacter atlanticus]EAP87839.1 hypothetical protein CA2559_03750 [Croceibacter atlanticus HTCC2559]MBW4969931.1 acyl-CoA thioesterase [Croceibacter atlanticus]